MAKPSITLVKKSAAKKAAIKPAAAGPVVNFTLQDNQDDTFTIFGTDAAGNTVDISGVATAVVTSDTVGILTVTSSGMTGSMHAVGPVGSAKITAVVTWTDGSLGPFTVTLPVTVSAGPTTGVVIVPGVPTVH